MLLKRGYRDSKSSDNLLELGLVKGFGIFCVAFCRNIEKCCKIYNTFCRRMSFGDFVVKTKNYAIIGLWMKFHAMQLVLM